MTPVMTILFNLLVILLCLSQSHGSDESSAPDTVATLNASAYLGRWYQTFGSAIPLSTFEKDGYCITADYFNPSAVGLKGLSFSLVNTLNKGAPAGPAEQANGTSVTKDFTQDPGKWAVFFDQFPSYFHFPYWILATGPLAAYPSSCFKGVAKCYAWAIVSDPFRSSLFILSRNVTQFNTLYKNATLAFAKYNGFDKYYNKPKEIYQQPDCVYAPPPLSV